MIYLVIPSKNRVNIDQNTDRSQANNSANSRLKPKKVKTQGKECETTLNMSVQN